MIDWAKVITPQDKFEQSRERKYQEIGEAFSVHIQGSVQVSLGFPMQFDVKDMLMVRGAIEFAQATGAETIYLTDAEDVTHYGVSLADAQATLVEMTAAFAAAHARKQALRAFVEAAATPERLEAITWNMQLPS